MPSIIQSNVGSKDLSENFSLREPSVWSKGGKDARVKLLEISFAKCQKSREEIALERFWHFLLLKKIRLSMITARNTKKHEFQQMDGYLSIFDSTTTSKVKLGLFSFSIREWEIYDCIPETINSFMCSAQKKRICDTKAIIIPRKIRIVLFCLWSSHLADLKCEKHLCLGGSWSWIEGIEKQTEMRLWSEEPNEEKSWTE